jgi:hypothetical protein
VCLVLILAIFSPRLGAALWWLIQPDRWDTAFGSWIWPVLGIIFLPWTTIMWVTVAPFGNAYGADWLWLAIGFMVDVVSWAGNGFGGRRQYSSYNRY